MPLSKGRRPRRRMPMFIVMPLLPLGLMAAAITLGLATYRHLKTLDEKLDHLLEIAGTPRATYLFLTKPRRFTAGLRSVFRLRGCDGCLQQPG